MVVPTATAKSVTMLPGYLDMLVGRLPELRGALRPAPMLKNSVRQATS